MNIICQTKKYEDTQEVWFFRQDPCVPDCVAISKATHIDAFVIPGLTRNPVFAQSVTLLDAGSGPA